MLPKEIGLLTELLYLNLRCNCIIKVPMELGALVQLQKLDLSHNNISVIPHEFCLMKAIIWLDLSHNSLEALPPTFGTLPSLHTLYASHNKLSKLPSSFHHLQSLEELYLASNRFQEIDSSAALCRVRVMDFESNRIHHLSVKVVEMQNLQHLNLRHNAMKSLPLEIEDRINTVQIDLSQNPLSDMPLPNSCRRKETDVFQFMRDEKVIYKPSVEVWNVNKKAFLDSRLLFDDFFNGVLRRCDHLANYQSSSSSLNMASLLQDKKYKDRLKRFFFHCKLHGNPPAYEQLGEKELRTREADSRRIHETRLQQIQLNRVPYDSQFYLGDLYARCAVAQEKISYVQHQREEMKDKEDQLLLEQLKENLEQRVKVDLQVKEKKELKVKRDAEELNLISFQSHRNKKRLLPVETNPCWK